MNDARNVFGHDRPERWSVLYVQVEGEPLTTSAAAASATELLAEVPFTRGGRRPRLALGTTVQVSWGWRGTVRTRPYELRDVRTDSGRPQWVLVPTAQSTEGTRRAVPRYDLAVPAVLVVDGVRLSGETVDVSVAGVRLALPPASASQGLPEAGTTGELAVLLDDVRTAVEVSIVRAAALADGSGDVRVFVVGGDDDDRHRLRAFVLGAQAREGSDGELPPAQPNEVPVSAS